MLSCLVAGVLQLLLYTVQRSMSGGGSDSRQGNPYDARMQQGNPYAQRGGNPYGNSPYGDPRQDPRFRQQQDPRIYQQMDPRVHQDPRWALCLDPISWVTQQLFVPACGGSTVLAKQSVIIWRVAMSGCRKRVHSMFRIKSCNVLQSTLTEQTAPHAACWLCWQVRCLPRLWTLWPLQP